jgi:thymidylate kinase
MTETLQAVTRNGVIGTITLDGGRLLASSEAMQDISDSWMRRKGSAQAAFTAMSGWYNGYLAFVPAERTAAHTASLARPYERTQHGHHEHVRGYVTRPPVTRESAAVQGWIPEADWLRGQQAWKTRGEAAWRIRGDAAESRIAAERAARTAGVGHRYVPLDDAEFAERKKHVASQQRQAVREGLDTQHMHTVGHDLKTYTPERAAIHKEIVQEELDKAKDIPREHKAVMTGGLPGAGKSTSLQKLFGKDVDKQYYTVNTDDYKIALAKRGLVPARGGTSPMELHQLAAKESNDLTNLILAAMTERGTNVIVDGTMTSLPLVQLRADTLRKDGYSVRAVFVHVPLDTALERADARYRFDMEEYRQGRGMGGRYIPAEFETSHFADPHNKKSSLAEKSYHHLRDLGVFDQWDEFDNTVAGQQPKLVRSSSDKGVVAPS